MIIIARKIERILSYHYTQEIKTCSRKFLPNIHSYRTDAEQEMILFLKSQKRKRIF